MKQIMITLESPEIKALEKGDDKNAIAKVNLVLIIQPFPYVKTLVYCFGNVNAQIFLKLYCV